MLWERSPALEKARQHEISARIYLRHAYPADDACNHEHPLGGAALGLCLQDPVGHWWTFRTWERMESHFALILEAAPFAVVQHHQKWFTMCRTHGLSGLLSRFFTSRPSFSLIFLALCHTSRLCRIPAYLGFSNGKKKEGQLHNRGQYVTSNINKIMNTAKIRKLYIYS